MASQSWHTPPPETMVYELSFPCPGVMLATINRPKQMNSINLQGHLEGEAIFNWLDDEPSLTVAIVTGKGDKAFCAGADLIEQRDRGRSNQEGLRMSGAGFGGLSRRAGKKPVIAAVNGFALGGGFEICLNCDIVVASPQASFGLPEVQVGLYAAAGGLSRIARICGMQRASELALTARRMQAPEAQQLGFVSVISKTHDSVIDEALTVAKKIASLNPDAIIVTRAGLRDSWEHGSVERASQMTAERYGRALAQSENMKIGLEAFAAKKQPKWVPAKL